MKKFIIDEELAQAILNYLANRPFIEVYKMVQALQNVKEHVEQVKEKDEKK